MGLKNDLFPHVFCGYKDKYLKGNIAGLSIWFRSFKCVVS